MSSRHPKKPPQETGSNQAKPIHANEAEQE
jgi:hypothetical protein